MGQMSKRRDHIPSWFCPSFCEDTPLKNNRCWKIIFRHLISRSLTLINQQMYMSSSFILRSSQINELIESRAFGSMTRPQRNQEQTGCDDIHPMSSAEITRGARGLHSITPFELLPAWSSPASVTPGTSDVTTWQSIAE